MASQPFSTTHIRNGGKSAVMLEPLPLCSSSCCSSNSSVPLGSRSLQRLAVGDDFRGDDFRPGQISPPPQTPDAIGAQPRVPSGGHHTTAWTQGHRIAEGCGAFVKRVGDVPVWRKFSVEQTGPLRPGARVMHVQEASSSQRGYRSRSCSRIPLSMMSLVGIRKASPVACRTTFLWVPNSPSR